MPDGARCSAVAVDATNQWWFGFLRHASCHAMKISIIFFLFIGSLFAADTTNSVPDYKRLVEVSFAGDDKPPSTFFHEIDYLWISENIRGIDRDYYSWADHGGQVGVHSDNQKKAEECRKLLQTVDEPKQLPDSPNKIVTVRCAVGDKIIIKRFPIDAVPQVVHDILTIMGFPDENFTRLKFVK
jgi:hypothetical protein